MLPRSCVARLEVAFEVYRVAVIDQNVYKRARLLAGLGSYRSSFPAGEGVPDNKKKDMRLGRSCGL